MTSDEPVEPPLAYGSPGFFEAIVETSVDPFVVVDHDLVLIYASPSIEHLLGWHPQEWLGRSIAELLEPESLEVAGQGIAEIANRPSDPTWVGAPVRLHLTNSDGVDIPIDAIAQDMIRTGVDGYVVQLHRAARSQAFSDAVDTILEGGDLDHALWQLTSLIEHDITRATAVLGSDWDGDRFARAAGDSRLLRLDALGKADRDAIRFALLSGQPVTDIFDRLSPATQDAARQADFHTCWCAPVVGDSITAALIIWHTEPGPPGSIYRVDINRSVNLTRLALEWTSQQRRVAWEISHDQLTGLTNRSEFQNVLDASSGRPRSVLFCDLDDFKPVNERFGHRVGDRVLAAVAGRMQGVSDDRVVARLGGDEFAILIDGSADLDAALELAASVQQSLATPIAVDDHRAQLGVTIGVACDPTGTAHSDLLMDEADRLLLVGKAQGKNQVLSVTLER